jgi:hypothetical protein
MELTIEEFNDICVNWKELQENKLPDLIARSKELIPYLPMMEYMARYRAVFYIKRTAGMIMDKYADYWFPDDEEQILSPEEKDFADRALLDHNTFVNINDE